MATETEKHAAQLEDLFEILSLIDACGLPNTSDPDVYLHNIVKDTEYKMLIDEAVEHAAATLITSDGTCDWDAIRCVTHAGYEVFAGEKDSFGWLSGCIQTKKGILVYD